jgi:hypothetical protein
MIWKKVSDGLPGVDCMCLVVNIKRPFSKEIAIYQRYCEEFMHQNYSRILDFPLHVTHYIQIPEPPDES